MTTSAATKVRPLGDRVLVRPLQREEMTKSGIVLPDTTSEKPQEGTVLAVGAGRRTESGQVVPIDVQVGDRVVFAKYAGTDIKLDNVDHLILRESDILGIIKSE